MIKNIQINSFLTVVLFLGILYGSPALLCLELGDFSLAPIFWYSILIILFKIIRTEHISIRKEEIYLSTYLFLLIAIGFVRGGGGNSLFREINGYLGLMIIYLAVRLLLSDGSRNKMDTFFKLMYQTFFYYIIFVGGLQIAYIYGGHASVLYNLFDSLVVRGMSYLDGGRLPFLYGESSFVGTYLYAFFMPAYFYCMERELYSKKYLKCSLILIVLINLFSLSTRFAFDSVFFLVVLYLLKQNKRYISLKRTLVIIAMIVTILMIIFFVMNMIQNNLVLIRLGRIFNGDISEDASFVMRIIYFVSAIYGFFNEPIIGYGFGNYSIALNENYGKLDLPLNEMALSELNSVLNINYDTSFSFYSTFLAENGLLALLFFYLLYKNMMKFSSEIKVLKYVTYIMAFMFLQTELYGCQLMGMWLAVVNSQTLKNTVIEIRSERNNESIYNHTLP